MAAKDRTDDLIAKTDVLIRDLRQAPARSAGRTASDLRVTVNALETTLQSAWDYVGATEERKRDINLGTRFAEVLGAYERGSDSLALHERRRSSPRNDP